MERMWHGKKCQISSEKVYLEKVEEILLSEISLLPFTSFTFLHAGRAESSGTFAHLCFVTFLNRD